MSEFLENVSLFRGIDTLKYGSLMACSRIRQYSKGEIIAHEGSSCSSIGIMTGGEAALQKINPDGEFATIALISTGDFFGEDIIYSTDKSFKVTIEAVSSCTVQYFSRQILDDLMKAEPVVKDNLLCILSDRISQMNRRIEILSMKTNREKISCYLMDLYSISEKHSGIVELPASKEVVSKLLAMSRPSMSRELSSMEKDGLIKVNGRTVELLDIKKIQMEIAESLCD